MADVVCVGAHPDDVEIGMGGTVAGLAARGLEVTILDLTDGEPTPYGTPETRRAEAARAAEILGVKRLTLDLPNRYLFDSVEARTAVAEVLRDERPGMLFAPFPEDAHPDHVAASAIVRAARFYAKFTKTSMKGTPHYPGRLYHYMAVHMRLVREPSFVVDITDTLAVKLDVLNAYESQFAANPHNADVITMAERTATMWGAMIRQPAGEPFFAEEPVGVRRLEDLV